jgi:hypothetical protein
VGVYENFNRTKSDYTEMMNKNTKQDDYENCVKVIKGRHGTFHNSDVKEEKENTKKEFVGTKHWRTTYASAIKDPYASARATQPDWSVYKKAYQVDHPIGKTEYKVFKLKLNLI